MRSLWQRLPLRRSTVYTSSPDGYKFIVVLNDGHFTEHAGYGRSQSHVSLMTTWSSPYVRYIEYDSRARRAASRKTNDTSCRDPISVDYLYTVARTRSFCLSISVTMKRILSSQNSPSWLRAFHSVTGDPEAELIVRFPSTHVWHTLFLNVPLSRAKRKASRLSELRRSITSAKVQ